MLAEVQLTLSLAFLCIVQEHCPFVRHLYSHMGLFCPRWLASKIADCVM